MTESARPGHQSGGRITRRVQREGLHPTRLIAIAFAVVIAVGTLLLVLPLSSADAHWHSPFVALFTATSATCVTGLVVVDTAKHWSVFGQGVIALLIQVGGFGIMTMASIVALAIFRRLQFRYRALAQAETGALTLGDVRRTVIGVGIITLLFESVVTAALFVRFLTATDMPALNAAGSAAFHAVSAFNNAGFSLFSDGLVDFVSDAWISCTIAFAVIVGGIGFPVLIELRSSLRTPRTWSVHTKLTLVATSVLLVAGMLVVLAFEWSNPGTLGDLDVKGKLVAGFFQGMTPRTAGFNTVDYAAMHEPTLLATSFLMFVGAGSASTGGGVKLTTMTLLVLAVWAELRSESEPYAFGLRFPNTVVRQAFTIATLFAAVVAVGAVALSVFSQFPLTQTLFESVSAVGTVGLSTGITPNLPLPAQAILVPMMFVGRIGPLTIGTALAVRRRERLYRLPEGRPIIG